LQTPNNRAIYNHQQRETKMTNEATKVITTVVAAVLLIAGIGLLFSYFIMLLWNGCLVPAVSVLSEITWLQAWGIAILSGMLFKSTNVSASK
jgi:hypothetical protein